MNHLDTPALAFMGLGMPELIIIFVVILLFFGGAKLPSLARGLGQSIKEFKKASKEDDHTESSKQEDSSKKVEASSKAKPGAN